MDYAIKINNVSKLITDDVSMLLNFLKETGNGNFIGFYAEIIL